VAIGRAEETGPRLPGRRGSQFRTGGTLIQTVGPNFLSATLSERLGANVSFQRGRGTAMIGVRLEAIGEPATVEEVPDPVLVAGAAVIRWSPCVFRHTRPTCSRDRWATTYQPHWCQARLASGRSRLWPMTCFTCSPDR
jgi:hypothetical protein